MPVLNKRVLLPAIQIALDFTSLTDALRIAVLARGLDNIILEAGTPLIKTEGIKAVAILKNSTDLPILADTKTFDAAEVEAIVASKAGAEVFTVMGVAPRATIEKAIEVARTHSIDLQIDMMGIPSILETTLEMAEKGVDIIGLHVGIDVQKREGRRADSLMELIREIRKSVDNRVLVSVAGGIKPREVPSFTRAGADIVVIGSAITSSKHPFNEIRTAASLAL